MIQSIYFPNTVPERDQKIYRIGESCDKIERIFKNGENAAIAWFRVIKGNEIVAEIKESVCDIFFENEYLEQRINCNIESHS